MTYISTYQAHDLINKTKGRFFSAIFVKKNSDVRMINCRTGVKKGVNGKGMKYDPLRYGLRTVYDIKKGGFRMLNLDTVQSMRVNKKSYVIIRNR